MTSTPPRRLLVVFGLRGTMLERLHKSKVPATMPLPTTSIGMHQVWLRPQLIPTLRELSAHCDFGIWSSATKRNTDPLVKLVLPAAEGLKFKFVWSRENTLPDDFRRSVVIDPSDEWSTIKDITALTSEFPDVDPARTVFVDDTPSKLRTSAANCLWIDTCEGEKIEEPTALLRMRDFILDELVPARDVRTILPRKVAAAAKTTSTQ